MNEANFEPSGKSDRAEGLQFELEAIEKVLKESKTKTAEEPLQRKSTKHESNEKLSLEGEFPELKLDLADHDEKSIFDLFGELEKNEMIIGIVDALEEGELIVHDPEPKFFDGLFWMMGIYPHLPANVRKIEIVLNRPKKDFAHNIYHFPTVLAELIEEAQLESLTLRKFDPVFLVAAICGSLRDQEKLELLDLEDNSLTMLDLVFAIRGLPRPTDTQLTLKLNNNCLDDGLRLGEFLSLQSNLACLEVLTQKNGQRLKKGQILHSLRKRGVRVA